MTTEPSLPVTPEDYSRGVDEYDIWMQTSIKSKWLDFEVGLYRSKWFDYRFLHPVQATLKYVEAYVPVFRSIYTEKINSFAGPHVKPFKGNFFTLQPAVKSGLWRGRQVADAIGMPYDQFINESMRFTLQHWRQKFLPRPCHLYSEQVIEKVVARWEELQQARSYFSVEPEYLTANYRGVLDQNDHHEWLFGQIARRKNPDMLIEQLANVHKILPIEKIQSRYGQVPQ